MIQRHRVKEQNFKSLNRVRKGYSLGHYNRIYIRRHTMVYDLGHYTHTNIRDIPSCQTKDYTWCGLYLPNKMTFVLLFQIKCNFFKFSIPSKWRRFGFMTSQAWRLFSVCRHKRLILMHFFFFADFYKFHIFTIDLSFQYIYTCTCMIENFCLFKVDFYVFRGETVTKTKSY